MDKPYSEKSFTSVGPSDDKIWKGTSETTQKIPSTVVNICTNSRAFLSHKTLKLLIP